MMILYLSSLAIELQRLVYKYWGSLPPKAISPRLELIVLGFLLPALCVRIYHSLIVLGGEIGPSSNFVVHHVELHLNIVIVFHALLVKLFEISFLGIIKLLL